MIEAESIFFIVTTVSNEEQSSKLISALISEKLAACVSVTPVKSHYIWQGRLEETSEFQLQIKTSVATCEKLLHRIGELHPYDTPEILCFQSLRADAKYVSWVNEACGQSQEP